MDNDLSYPLNCLIIRVYEAVASKSGKKVKRAKKSGRLPKDQAAMRRKSLVQKVVSSPNTVSGSPPETGSIGKEVAPLC